MMRLPTHNATTRRPAPHPTPTPQVVQQQQQLQMSFAWSFLHVGQSMTANVFHAAPAAGGGPRAARRLATRIVRWAAVSCAVLAMLTYHNRCGDKDCLLWLD